MTWFIHTHIIVIDWEPMNIKCLFKYKRAWGLVIAAVLLFLSFHDLDTEKISSIISRADYRMLIPATICAFLMNLFKSLRWRVIIDPTLRIPVRNMLSIFSVGQMVNVSLPALTGQAARVLLLSKQTKLPKTYSATTVIIEVLFDGMSLLILLAASSTLVVIPGWMARSGLLAGIVLVVLLTGFLLIVHNRRRIRIYGRRRIKMKFPRLFDKVKNVSRSFADALDMLKSTRHTLLSILYSFGVWGAHILVIYFIIAALGIDISPGGALVILAVNSVLLMFPITPGNLGTFQWACIFSMTTLFGVPKESSISFSVVLQIMDLVPVYIAGIAFLMLDRLDFKELRHETIEEGKASCPRPNETETTSRKDSSIVVESPDLIETGVSGEGNEPDSI